LGCPTVNAAQVVAKAVIIEEVERLRWRLWNGKTKDAQIGIDRIRAVMHHFQDEQGVCKSIAPSRKLWTALHALNGYATGQSDWMVNYVERQRAGLRVGAAITEGTANFLVNRRMNKSQQKRGRDEGPSAAPGSLRGLQWHYLFRIRIEIPPLQRYTPASASDRRLTPKLEAGLANPGRFRCSQGSAAVVRPPRIGRRPSRMPDE
jgi:hypothetical protein